MKIGIFGRTNAGKSTLLNALTGQNVAIVSPQAGTTTDPVRRAYELLGVGKTTLVDTAGFDDQTPLGAQRLAKTMAVVDEVEAAIFLISGAEIDPLEREFVEGLECPTLVVGRDYKVDEVLAQLFDIVRSAKENKRSFYGDLLKENGSVILVCPIDGEAPEGRLILPQVQAIRAALDLHARVTVVQPEELEATLSAASSASSDLGLPDLVVTDSQAFGIVEPIVGGVVPLTSFSILLARQKGDSELYARGLEALEGLREGSRILMIEHCSHGVSCEDIARVKIPALMEAVFGIRFEFDIVSGRDSLPADLGVYSLAVQCGGCMVDSRPIGRRIAACRRAGLPITNYGMLLKKLSGACSTGGFKPL